MLLRDTVHRGESAAGADLPGGHWLPSEDLVDRIT